MNKHVYHKCLSVILAGLMVLSFCACGNKLEKDLKQAKEKVAKSEEQEKEMMELLEKMGLAIGGMDLSALEGLTDYGDLEALAGLGEEITEQADDQTSNQTTEADSLEILEENKSGKYVELLQGEQYYMEYTSYVMGMEGTGKSAAKGKDSSSITEMLGYTTRMLTLDGYIYDFDTAQKKYAKTEVTNANEYTNSMQNDFSGMEYVGSGKGVIPGISQTGYDGISLNYDEYQIAVDMSEFSSSEGSEMSMPIRFYMDGEELCAIYTKTMGIDTVMMIKTLSKEIPEEMFQIPSDYTEVDSLY